MILDIVLDFGYCVVSIWSNCYFFLVLKAALQKSDVILRTDFSSCFSIGLYPHSHYIHNTDDIFNKNRIVLYFVKSPTIISRLIENIIFDFVHITSPIFENLPIFFCAHV